MTEQLSVPCVVYCTGCGEEGTMELGDVLGLGDEDPILCPSCFDKSEFAE